MIARQNHRLSTRMAAIAAFALSVVSFSVDADEHVATYIEANGRIIELVSDLVSPLDPGTGEIVYTAYEADDLVTPANAETVGNTLRVIGWRRAGDRIVIYQTPTKTFEYPVSAMKYRIVNLLDTDESSGDEHPAYRERMRRPTAS